MLKYFEDVELPILLLSLKGEEIFSNKSFDLLKISKRDDLKKIKESKDLKNLHYMRCEERVEVAKIFIETFYLYVFRHDRSWEQKELFSLKASLNCEIANQKILFDFLNQADDLAERYAVVDLLLKKMIDHIKMEAIAFFRHDKIENKYILSHLYSSDGSKIRFYKLESFEEDHRFFQEKISVSLYTKNFSKEFHQYKTFLVTKLKSITMVPIKGKHGDDGFIQLINEREMGRDHRILGVLGNNLSQILGKINLYCISMTDSLTQLFNVRYFKQRIKSLVESSLEKKSIFGLLMIDVDHFKECNDAYGHLAGDLVLKNVANKIKKSCRNSDLASRYGGEEFTVLALEIKGLEDLFIFANRIRKNIEEITTIYRDHQIKVTLSIGIALFPVQAREYDELINVADTALYTAKRSGRNTVRSL